MFPYVLLGALIELNVDKTFKIRSIMTFKNLFHILALGFIGNIMSFGYIWSAEYTIMSHV